MQISVLITTYNRVKLLKRALESVFSQTFKDFEVVLIDDASTDSTVDMLRQPENKFWDERLRYIRNNKNQGHEHGDRIHIQRFVNELAKGEYFIYLCDDDYWLSPTLLERQLNLFNQYPDLSMVTGGQLSKFIDGSEKFHFPFPVGYQTSDELLAQVAETPIESNIITGARLYHRQRFIDSGALQGEGGKWEAGFEITIAPGAYGGHYYIGEPCVCTEIAPTNASFRGTQVTHYLDSVSSVKAGYRKPLLDFTNRNLPELQRQTILNISKSYLANAEHIKEYGSISYTSKENCSELVTPELVQSIMDGL